MKVSASTPAAAWLQQHRLRLTRGREAIIGTLLCSERPLTLTEIHKRVEGARCDFATVFRFVQILDRARLVERHAWDDRQLRYELIRGAEGHPHHHHHLVCKSCHKVEEVDACSVHALEKQLGRNKGYSEMTHSLAFYGICPDCQTRPTRQPKASAPSSRPARTPQVRMAPKRNRS